MTRVPNITREEIQAAISRIPRGSIVTFAEIDSSARAQVGRVQNNLKPQGWHRVVFSDGRVKNGQQRRLLEAEGIAFTAEGKVDFAAL